MGGAFGGRRLEVPFDERTRPMLEKTRGAVFNILGARSPARGSSTSTPARGRSASRRSRAAPPGRGSSSATAWRSAACARTSRRSARAIGAKSRRSRSRKPWRGPRPAASPSPSSIPYRDVEDRARRRAILGIAGDLVGRVLAPGDRWCFTSRPAPSARTSCPPASTARRAATAATRSPSFEDPKNDRIPRMIRCRE